MTDNKSLQNSIKDKMAEVIDDIVKLRTLFGSDEFTELLQTTNDKELTESDVAFLCTLSTFRDVLLEQFKADDFSF